MYASTYTTNGRRYGMIHGLIGTWAWESGEDCAYGFKTLDEALADAKSHEKHFRKIA